MADSAVPVRASRRVSVAGDVSYHPQDKFVFFSPPHQRQKWGDTQIEPRVNWGDLFFDLFYVGAAYNLGNILVTSPTSTGFLYFIGAFFPVMAMWNDKMYFDSRFVYGDDLWHRGFEVSVLLVLATAILHIRPVDILSNSSEYVSMFAFSLSLVLGSVLTIIRYIEVYFFGKGQPVIKTAAFRSIYHKFYSLAFYIAATIVAGIAFYGSQNDGHRILADTENSTTDTTNVPIYLVLAGTIAEQLKQAIAVVFCYPSGGRHKEFTVPMNIDFCIHRNGEWIMLMLGESVLSLLIVDVSEDTEYYLNFYAGILTVILLQYLHFRSQPHDPDQHAMRRHKNAGVGWSFINQIYSAALVALGASFKLFLYEHAYEQNHRLLRQLRRYLAGGAGESEFSTEDRRQRIANIFCTSMAIAWFCLDAMILLHIGLKDNMGRCYLDANGVCQNQKKKKNVKGIFIILLRFCLVVFMATLSLYETDPEQLALIGLAGVVAQLILRVLGSYYFKDIQVVHHHHTGPMEEGTEDRIIEEEDPEEYKWPNVTHAQAVEAEDADVKDPDVEDTVEE